MASDWEYWFAWFPVSVGTYYGKERRWWSWVQRRWIDKSPELKKAGYPRKIWRGHWVYYSPYSEKHAYMYRK